MQTYRIYYSDGSSQTFDQTTRQQNPPDYWTNDRIQHYASAAVSALVFLVVLATIWSLWLAPHWRVWASRKEGLADLAKAQNDAQIQRAEAQARLDAANLNKQASIIEAEAVSAQIETIGKQLTSHDLYLKWQWIKMMEERPENSVIYVPTEANIPILEVKPRA